MSQQQSWFSENWWVFIPIALVIGLVIALNWSISNFQHEVKQAYADLHKAMVEERKVWDGLDCVGKKQYLQGKDLSGNRIFYTSQNEDFYREYVINCLPPEIAKEVLN